MKLTLAGEEIDVSRASVRDRRSLAASIEGRSEEWPIRSEEGTVRVRMADGWRRFVVRRQGEEVWIAAGADLLCFRRQPEGARSRGETGSLTSPMPGRVLEVRVKPGDLVERGDTLAVVEAMKVEMPIVAPKAGRVKEIFHQAGDQIEAGIPLLLLE